MGIEQSTEHPEVFEFEGKSQAVSFVETLSVVEGVECDVYTFVGDDTKDLGIIRIEPGFSTPIQRVLQGLRTIEGYVSGEGQLIITRSNDQWEVYQVNERVSEKPSIDVNIGDLMQWQATGSSRLVAYEVCIPPYQDGRYENIE